jgi:hypothetical protein
MIAHYAEPNSKVLRFDMLAVGDQFRTHHDGWLLTKKSATSAVNPEDVLVNMRPAQTVDAILKGVVK